MKIVLADDHPLFRDGFSLLFQQMEAGAVVFEASSLDEAIDLVTKHRDADLVMLDLNMPGMNGLDGLKRVAETCPQMPVIVLSASESKEIVEAVIMAGASGFIPKSSSAAVMQSAIHLVLSGGVYLPAQILRADAMGSAGHREQIKLTNRQLDVLRLLAAGLSNKQICRDLELSEGTLKVHIAAIYRALNVNNRTEAANAAHRLALVD